jgi:glycerophosphoryl diester phosphodiesterase
VIPIRSISAEPCAERPRFELQGHRGARGLFPENTLEGFAAAMAIGVHAIELDVMMTCDGVAVVTHDPCLNPAIVRGPDGAWLTRCGPPVASLTYAQLIEFDVGRLRRGSAYAASFPTQAGKDGARIPALADVFRLTRGTRLRVDTELKTGPQPFGRPAPRQELADHVVACAEASGAVSRLVVRSFDWCGLRHLRRVRPDIALAWLTDTTPMDTDSVASIPRTIANAAADGPPASWTAVWAPNYTMLTPALLEEAHSLGLRVIPWTVNAVSDMARLIAWGADGICTDRPDLARTAMQNAGLALPQPAFV